MIAGDLPPSSNVNGVRFLAAVIATIRPIFTLPVKKI